MVVTNSISDVAITDKGIIDDNKGYVLAGMITVEEYADFDPSDYEVGEYVLVYEDAPTAPGPVPTMAKPLPGYSFTSEEKTAALEAYNAAMEAYATELEAYEEALAEYNEMAEATEFGYLIEIVSDTEYKIIADISYETTKTENQFGVMGKLPKEVPTKVGVAVGGLSVGDSIKGKPIASIIEKALKLETEESEVDTLKTV